MGTRILYAVNGKVYEIRYNFGLTAKALGTFSYKIAGTLVYTHCNCQDEDEVRKLIKSLPK